MLEARKAPNLAKWPLNGFRHSYASYHLAHFKDAARLALEMGHTD
jgi:integrase